MPGSPRPDESDSTAVAVEFLQVYLEDQSSGRTRSLIEYQALFPGHEAIVAEEFETVRSQHDPDEQATLFPGQGERYDARQEIGRGGMGVVERVHDPSLGREVAKKVLVLAEGRLPSPRQLRRFLHEARVMARLQHPGIVTVFEIGLDPDRSPYFTMPLITGQDLHQVLTAMHRGDRSWSLVRALGVLVRACEAMAHAHERGVVHRDLKPSNVMVGTAGETYVVDWGLARFADAEDARQLAFCGITDTPFKDGTDDLLRTLDGDVLGTPTYMAPEQARGDLAEIGPHSDVYSLGTMLYELLTGTPPYAQPHERPDSRATLAKVLAGPPTAVERLKSGLPAELVSICERAMSRDVADRYPSAAELGNDLRAFLEDRIVRAHASGWLTGTVKWVKRNLLAATALLLAFASLVVGLVVTTLQKRESDANALTALQNYNLAIHAGERLLADMGIGDVQVAPGAAPVRRLMLERALGYYRLFLDVRGEDPRVRQRIALCRMRLGAIAFALADFDDGRRELELAIDEFESLLATAASESDKRVLRQRAIVSKAHLLVIDAHQGATVEAEFRQLAAAIEELRATLPDDRDLLTDSLMVRGNLARALARSRDSEATLACIDGQLGDCDHLVQLPKAQSIDYERYGSLLALRGRILNGANRPVEAEQALRKSLEVLARGLEQFPGREGLKWRLCESRNILAIAYMGMGKRTTAIACWQDTVRDLRAYLGGSPRSWRVRRELAGVLCNLVKTTRPSRGAASVLPMIEEARAHLDEALELGADRKVYAGYLRNLAREHANTLNMLGRPDEAADKVADLLAVSPQRDRLTAALLFACCGISMRSQHEVEEGERQQRANTFDDRAMTLLQEAAQDGALPEDMLTRREFHSLRQRPEFRELQRRLQR